MSIYWGAWVEGHDTYTYLYPAEVPWTNAPWDAKTWARYEQNAGKAASIIHWGVGTFLSHPFTYWAGTLDIARNRGALNLVDIDTGSASLASIAAGAQDAAITAWAKGAAAWGHPFFLRLNWEMNGGWFPWGTTPSNQNTPADYVAAWRHIHDLFAAAGATNVTWVWCPNLAFPGSVPFAQLYPGDAYVDWVGLDGYNQDATSASFYSLYLPSYKALRVIAPTKPVMVCEVGSLEYAPGAKATWLSHMLAALPARFPRVKAVVYFNWRIHESGVWKDWEIESSPKSQAAFKAGIASPYFAPAGSFAMPPPLTRIQRLA